MVLGNDGCNLGEYRAREVPDARLRQVRHPVLPQVGCGWALTVGIPRAAVFDEPLPKLVALRGGENRLQEQLPQSGMAEDVAYRGATIADDEAGHVPGRPIDLDLPCK